MGPNWLSPTHNTLCVASAACTGLNLWPPGRCRQNVKRMAVATQKRVWLSDLETIKIQSGGLMNGCCLQRCSLGSDWSSHTLSYMLPFT